MGLGLGLHPLGLATPSRALFHSPFTRTVTQCARLYVSSARDPHSSVITNDHTSVVSETLSDNYRWVGSHLHVLACLPCWMQCSLHRQPVHQDDGLTRRLTIVICERFRVPALSSFLICQLHVNCTHFICTRDRPLLQTRSLLTIQT